MIWIDELFDTTPFTTSRTPRCFRNTMASHMISDLPGLAGTAELVAFARRLGLREEWIQHPRSPREHFDLVASKRERAVELGARECSTERLVEIEQEKLEAGYRTMLGTEEGRERVRGMLRQMPGGSFWRRRLFELLTEAEIVAGEGG